MTALDRLSALAATSVVFIAIFVLPFRPVHAQEADVGSIPSDDLIDYASLSIPDDDTLAIVAQEVAKLPQAPDDLRDVGDRGGDAFVVGDGTPTSCTQAALVSALAAAGASGGGLIRFNCGSDPVTVPLVTIETTIASRPIALLIPDNTAIDGGGLITLEGDVDAIDLIDLFVDKDTTAHLRNLSIVLHTPRRPGNGTGVLNAGRFAIRNCVFSGDGTGLSSSTLRNEGTLTITNSALYNFVALNGVIQNLGTLTVKGSAFSENRFSAIYNSGTTMVENSTFSDSLGGYTGIGGAIFNTGALRIKNSAFSNNHASYKGGAIYNGGVATIETTSLAIVAVTMEAQSPALG